MTPDPVAFGTGGGEAAPAVAPDDGRTFGRSWVNVLIDGVERLPGPSWVAYLIGLLLMTVFLASTDLMSGVPVGQLAPDRAVWAVAIVGSAWLIHHLDHVARAALHDFAPLLGASPATIEALEPELTVIPVTPSRVILGISAFRTAEGFASSLRPRGSRASRPFRLRSDTCSRRS